MAVYLSNATTVDSGGFNTEVEVDYEKLNGLFWKIEDALDSRDYSSAISYSNEALALSPSDPLYESFFYYFRGSAYSQLGDNDLALKDLNKAIELSSLDEPEWVISEFYMERGNLYDKMGDPDSAVADWKVAARDGDPSAIDKLNDLGIDW